LKKSKRKKDSTVDYPVSNGIKRKNDTAETPVKKKKRESESYIKFESPHIDSTLNDLDIVQNGASSSPEGKKKKKKKSNDLVTIDKSKNYVVSEFPETVVEYKKNKRRKLKNKLKEKIVEDGTTEKKDSSEKISKNKRKKEKRKVIKSDQDKIELPLPFVKSTGTSEIAKISNNTQKKAKPFVNKLKKLFENAATFNAEQETPNTEEKTDTSNDDSKTILMTMNEVHEKSPSTPKSLRDRMMERLKSARFRYLNEQMYRKDSNEAIQIFRRDPEAFKAYHAGYQQQVNKWPMNPLDIIIKDISKLLVFLN
jgi:hypothetical protein